MEKYCIKYINKRGLVVRNKEGRKDLVRCLQWSTDNKSKISYVKNNRATGEHNG